MARRSRFSDNGEPRPKVNREQFREAMKIFVFVKPYRGQIIIGLLLLFISSLVFMVFPYMAGQMVDIAQGESEFGWTLKDVGWLLLAVLLIQGLVSYSRVMLFAHASEKGIADVRRALYEKMVSLPIAFFEQNRVGELISRLTADVEKLYNAFSIVLAEFLRQIIIILTGVIFLAITTPRLALIMLGTFPLVVVGAMIFGRRIRRLSRERQDAMADSNVILDESLQSIQIVKSFTNEWFEVARYDVSIGVMVRRAIRFAQGRAWFSVFIVSILFGALFFIIWEGANMLQRDEITAGLLISFVAYTAIIGAAIAGLGSFYTQLLSAVGATERVREILNAESELVPDKPTAVSATSLKGHVQYVDVHFTYPTRDDIPILKGLDLDIEAGSKVALVGASGAGKSTIVQLLMRFYELQGGDILVDGKSIFDFEISDYRNHLAVVPQEVILFGGTIRENILYGDPDASDAALIEAAKKANAWEFISGFPEGLDTIVGERGIKLSGGQRQRIAIARAILRDPAILILDEATSALDAESEKIVQGALNTLMEGRTSIIIAHRLATIRDVDCIYVIDQGRIIEKGTHNELSERENGAYSSLAKLQFEVN